MVGGADGYGVDLVAELVEHFPVVGELLRFGEMRGLSCESFVVHVAEGDDLAILGGAVNVAGAFAPDADASNVDFVVGGFALGREGDAASGPEAEAGDGDSCMNRRRVVRLLMESLLCGWNVAQS